MPAKNIPVEVEGKEIAIQNEFGDIAVIPKSLVSEVRKHIDEKCYNCIDKIVSSLPTLKNYNN